MAKKVLARSAAILDEADRFEDVLNWQLFTAEQDTKLWGYNPDVTWSPGTPLYPDPRCSYVPSVEARRMIEVFVDGNELDKMRCELCGVSWVGGEPCFVCGEERPRPSIWPIRDTAPRRTFIFGALESFLGHANETSNPFIRFEEALRRSYAAVDAQIMRHMLGFSSLSPEEPIWEIVPYDPPKPYLHTLFEASSAPKMSVQEILSPIGSLYDPLGESTGGHVVIPVGWRSMRRDVLMPPKIRCTDLSSFKDRSYPGIKPATEEKRRRRHGGKRR